MCDIDNYLILLLDCHNLAGRQLRFLGKLLTVELCYKTAEESFSADEPQLSKDDHIPYLKLSGLPEVPPGLDVAEALKQTFRNQLPKPDDLGNIEVELTGASEAVVEFENSQSKENCIHSLIPVSINSFCLYFRLPLLG